MCPMGQNVLIPLNCILIILCCVMYKTKVMHVTTLSFVLKICWFLQKMLMSATFWWTIGNFHKFAEAAYDYEVAYPISSL